MGRRVLSDEQVLQIRADTRSYTKIVKDVGLNRTGIRDIKHGKAYSGVIGEPAHINKSSKLGRILSDDQVRKIRADTRSLSAITNDPENRGISSTMIWKIKRKQRYGDVTGPEPHINTRPSHYLTDDQIRAIRANTDQLGNIAKSFGISRQMVFFIKHKKQYAKVSGPEPYVTVYERKLSADEVRELRADTRTMAQIAADPKYKGITVPTVSRIKNKKIYADVTGPDSYFRRKT